MKAISQSLYGTPDVLRSELIPAPRLDGKSLRVRVTHSAVTAGDLRLRSGDFPGITWLPGRLAMGLWGPRAAVPGTAFAGEVIECGNEVQGYAPGDAVFGLVMNGAWADELVVPADAGVARRPSDLGPEAAVCLPFGAITAMDFVQGQLQVQAGQRVCVVGAAGGVGHFAVQLAAHLGAHVTAVCRPEDEAFVRGLGASAWLPRDADLAAAGPFDAILDTPGALSFARARSALSSNGVYSSLLVTLGLLFALVTNGLRSRKARTTVSGVTASSLAQAAELFAGGAFRATVDSRFPLDRIAEAHRHAEQGRPRGVVVVEVASPQRGSAVA